MSIATQLERLQTDRNTIRDKLIELGLAESTANLTALAAAIEDIVNQGAVQVEIVEGTSYTIPVGYHNGSGTVKAMTDTTGEAEKYKVQAKTVTPTKNQQNITPDTGYYALSAVTVAAIPEAYQNVSSVTAAAGNVLVGKIFVTADGTVTTGTMANNGAVSKILDGTTVSYTIPAGYHNGSGKVTITVEKKSVTPTKSAQTVRPEDGRLLSEVYVTAIPDNYIDTTDATATETQILEGHTAYGYETNSSGEKVGKKIAGAMTDNGAVSKELTKADYATGYTVPAGYHNGSGKVTIKTQAKTVTPTNSRQIINGDNNAFLNSVTVEAIPSPYFDTSGVTATADKVLTDSVFIDSTGAEVEGAMQNNGAVTTTLNTIATKYFIPEGYHNGEGTVSLTTETKSVTPSTSIQSITPSSGKVLSKVTVEAIPSPYFDTSGTTATAETVLAGKKFVNATGTTVTGSMKDYGNKQATIDGLTATSVTLDGGYYESVYVNLTSDIEEALAAI